MLLLVLLLTVPEAPARKMIVEMALAQAKKPSADWQQRDCSGLVRYAYRRAFRNFGDGQAFSRFADAEALIQNEFQFLGRDARLRAKAADVLAYRTEDDGFHLMMLVQGEDRARTDTLVVYSPGNGTSEVRVGTLRELEQRAPAEWRPVPTNPRFLGYYRYKDWGLQ